MSDPIPTIPWSPRFSSCHLHVVFLRGLFFIRVSGETRTEEVHEHGFPRLFPVLQSAAQSTQSSLSSTLRCCVSTTALLHLTSNTSLECPFATRGMKRPGAPMSCCHHGQSPSSGCCRTVPVPSPWHTGSWGCALIPPDVAHPSPGTPAPAQPTPVWALPVGTARNTSEISKEQRDCEKDESHQKPREMSLLCCHPCCQGRGKETEGIELNGLFYPKNHRVVNARSREVSHFSVIPATVS